MTISHEAPKPPLAIRYLHTPAAFYLAHIYCLTWSPKISSCLRSTRAPHTSLRTYIQEPILRSYSKLQTLRSYHLHNHLAREPRRDRHDLCLYCLLPVIPASSMNRGTKRPRGARSPAHTLAGQATMPASCHTIYVKVFGRVCMYRKRIQEKIFLSRRFGDQSRKRCVAGYSYNIGSCCNCAFWIVDCDTATFFCVYSLLLDTHLHSCSLVRQTSIMPANILHFWAGPTRHLL